MGADLFFALLGGTGGAAGVFATWPSWLRRARISALIRSSAVAGVWAATWFATLTGTAAGGTVAAACTGFDDFCALGFDFDNFFLLAGTSLSPLSPSDGESKSEYSPRLRAPSSVGVLSESSSSVVEFGGGGVVPPTSIS